MNTEQTFDDIDADLNHFNELYPSLQTSHENQYYDSDEFNRLFGNGRVNDFSVIHVNIRSMGVSYYCDALVVYLS